MSTVKEAPGWGDGTLKINDDSDGCVSITAQESVLAAYCYLVVPRAELLAAIATECDVTFTEKRHD